MSGGLIIGLNNIFIQTNLTSLEAITSIGCVPAIYNTELTTLSGLDGLTSFGNGSLDIRENPVLTTLSGITSIYWSLRIGGNDSLTTLSGLGNLNSVNNIHIGILKSFAVQCPNLSIFCALTDLFESNIYTLVYIANNAYNPTV
ncbi:MAG: hypothetical protein COA88_05160 [Kordia sp.]|nr:MAG: hypothetical protein COA88_05160 [Kordia sp.]